MEAYWNFILPPVGLFIAQTGLCLWVKNKFFRLIPTLIALGIAVYYIGGILLNLDDLWSPLMGVGVLGLCVLPPLAAVGLGWIIYVVKLMVLEIRHYAKGAEL